MGNEKVFFFFLVLIISIGSCDSENDAYDPYKQFQEDIEAIDSYLDNNGIDAYRDRSGIRFLIGEIGTLGLPPKLNQTVKINYRGGLFTTGEIFDSNTTEGILSTYGVDGWKLGVSLFPEGTKGTIFVPSGLAYKNQAVGSIPPNSILVFDIELLEVKFSDQEQAKLESDLAVIDSYLSDNSIEAEIDPLSGIRFVIEELGPGNFPTWYDKIKVSYTGKILSSGQEFFSGTLEPTADFDSRVVDYLQGLQAGFLQLPAGSKATFYVPSVFAYGDVASGNGTIPANSNIIYEVESIEIMK